MCGIVGLFLKDPALQPDLGKHLAVMLETMTARGPDSAGFAVYGDGVPERTKITFRGPARFDAEAFGLALASTLGADVDLVQRDTHIVVTVSSSAVESALATIKELAPDLSLSSIGAHMELYKEVGLPADVARALRPRRHERDPWRRPYADGDGIGGDDGGRASVLDRQGPVPRAQRLALEPQSDCAAS